MQPVVKPLSQWQRKIVFGSLLLAFMVSLPAFIFYAAGYRYDLTNPKASFKATGGFYVVSDTPEGVIYLDDKPAQNIRSFRSAAYLQGIEPGLHRLYVQAPGLHTWVKELPVAAHMVTEAEAFNLPVIPQVRLVPQYTTTQNNPVIFAKSTSTPVLSYVGTSSVPLYFATSSATSTYQANQEYALLESLFKEQASTTAARKAFELQQRERFGFSTSTGTTSAEINIATTTVYNGQVALYEVEGDVYAQANQDSFRQIPHYFCAPQIAESDILVGASTLPVGKSAVSEVATSTNKTLCRERIKIDRLGQIVDSFAFFPTNANLVLMHLTDGIYVIEIDDRAWQNAQPLYRGEDLELLLYRDGIFIKERGLIFEVMTGLVGN